MIFKELQAEAYEVQVGPTMFTRRYSPEENDVRRNSDIGGVVGGVVNGITKLVSDDEVVIDTPKVWEAFKSSLSETEAGIMERFRRADTEPEKGIKDLTLAVQQETFREMLKALGIALSGDVDALVAKYMGVWLPKAAILGAGQINDARKFVQRLVEFGIDPFEAGRLQLRRRETLTQPYKNLKIFDILTDYVAAEIAANILFRVPRVLDSSDERIKTSFDSLIELFGSQEACNLVERNPILITVKNIKKNYSELVAIYGEDEAKRIINICPRALSGGHIENVHEKISNEIGVDCALRAGKTNPRIYTCSPAKIQAVIDLLRESFGPREIVKACTSNVRIFTSSVASIASAIQDLKNIFGLIEFKQVVAKSPTTLSSGNIQIAYAEYVRIFGEAFARTHLLRDPSGLRLKAKSIRSKYEARLEELGSLEAVKARLEENAGILRKD